MLLCCIEWLEGPSHYLNGHSAAAVGYGQEHILARADFWVRGSVIFIEVSISGFDCEPAAVGHGITGIHSQIDYAGFHLICVGPDRPKRPSKYRLNSNLFAESAPQQL